jgi:hypothetical protein
VTTPAESPTDQSTPADPATPVDLTNRYGRRKGLGRRGVIGVFVALGVIAIAFAYWATVLQQSKVTWQDNSYDVQSASSVLVTFDVQFHRGTKKAVCTVHALNPLNTEVGLRDVVVEGSRTGRVQMKVTVPTSEEATTGVVEECVAK